MLGVIELVVLNSMIARLPPIETAIRDGFDSSLKIALSKNATSSIPLEYVFI